MMLSVTAVDDGGPAFTLDEDTVLQNTASITLVQSGPSGAVWRYLDNGSNQGTAWRDPAFNDTAWAFGRGQLGYGDGDETTVVGFGPNANNKFITTYFRHTFDTTDLGITSTEQLAQITSLVFNFIRDDGIAVYLNGVEMFRDNLPQNPAFDAPATGTVAGAAESAVNTFTSLNTAVLVVGDNTLAVEIHQDNPGSSDISFDLQVLANISGRAPILLNDDLSNANGPVRVSKVADPVDSVSGQPAGVVQMSPDGNFTYTPPANYFGTATFQYRLIDDDMVPSIATVTLTVNPVADPVTAVPDQYTMAEDTTLVVNVVVPPQQGTLLPINATWRLLDQLNRGETYPLDDEGRPWFHPDFDTTTSAPSIGQWRQGAGPFAQGAINYYQSAGLTPTVLAGNASNTTTYLFRSTFTVANAAAIQQLTASLLCDDGCVIYINGQEVGRPNMPGGVINSDTLSAGVGVEDQLTAVTLNVLDALVDGVNSIAVELHQSDLGSSDAGFALELTTGASGRVGLLANDLNPDRIEGLTIELLDFVGPRYGTLQLNNDGTFVYQPNADYFGPDVFIYRLVGGGQSSNFAEVNIQVQPRPELPRATNDSYVIEANTTLNAALPNYAADATNPASTRLVPFGATWRYLANGSNQGTAWREPGFNDAQWPSGPAELGYGDGDEATIVPFGPDPGNKFVTTYFRTTFNTDTAGIDADQVTELIVHLKRDDGAAVYLNGVEIVRDNLRVDAAFNHLAGFIIGPLGEEGIYTHRVDLSTLPEGTLRQGLNTLAVEVHQSSPESSDLSMNLALTVPGSPFGLLANDIDPDARGGEEGGGNLPPLRASLVGTPSAGSATVNPDGTFTYMPPFGFSGEATFTYRLARQGDPNGVLATATILVNASNIPPVAVDDQYDALPDQPLMILDPAQGLLANDSDDEGDPLTAIIVDDPDPSQGEVTLFDDGTFVFVPEPGFIGEASFTYRVVDPFGQSNVAVVRINVEAVVAVPGDLDLDGDADADDIDLLAAAIRTGDGNPIYDLNLDGVVDQADHHYLIHDILMTRPGDTDLSQSVSIRDLRNLATWFAMGGEDGSGGAGSGFGGASVGWAQGDTNGDGVVNITDLAALAAHIGYNLPLIQAALANPDGSAVTGQIIRLPNITSFRAGFDDTPVDQYADVLGDLTIDPVLGEDAFHFDAARLNQINGSPLADGPHTLHLTAADAFGNVTAPFSISFILNTGGGGGSGDADDEEDDMIDLLALIETPAGG